MKILSFTTLFPNVAQPRHGVFVEQRLLQLQATGEVELRVVAPVPWFPLPEKLATQYFASYARYAQVPANAERHGVSVLQPKYPVIPKLGMNIAPALLAARAAPVLKKLLANGFDFDLIDAHYYYPDGVAAALLGKRFNKPVTITARGSDLNLLPDYPLPRRWIKWAERQAAASITVSEALRGKLIELGGNPQNIHTLRNGVDLQTFQPTHDRAALRSRLGFNRPTLLQVGNLVELKGQALSIAAMRSLPEYDLVLVGDGEQRGELQTQIDQLGLSDRVTLLGELPHSDLPGYFAAADALLLPSSREGLANVLLEAMACGCPVIATHVGGTPEVVTEPAAGIMLSERSAAALVNGVKQLFSQLPNRSETRQHASQFGWQATTDGLLELFRSVAGQPQALNNRPG